MGIFPDDNENDEGSSSTSETLDATSNEPQGTVEAPASSSDATGENVDKSTLSIVREVVGETGDASAAASPAEGSEDGSENDETDPKKELDNEEFSDVGFHKHPRFRELIAQRNSFRDDATRYQNVQSFLDQNAMTGEEAANVLHSAALAKTDPVKCWQEIKGWVQSVLIAAGEVLPDELSQRVNNGELSHADAIAISRANARATSVETTASFRQQQAERQRAEEHSNGLQGEAAAWEQERRKRDPNFEAKLPTIMEKLIVIQHREGKPTDRAGVSRQLKAAYDATNAAFKAPAAPAPAAVPAARRAIKPVTSGGSGGAPQAATERSTLDIVRAARGRG